MATSLTPWTPDWAVPPGEVLAEALAERRMTQAELARRMGRPLKTISEIATGKAAITPQTAIQLERTLGISAHFWNSLEVRFRDALARSEARYELESQTAWLKRFPLVAMASRGLIEQGRTEVDTLERLLTFFGVSQPSAWENQWSRLEAAFRSSDAYRPSPYSLSAWLRWGEVLASDIELADYDPSALRLAITQLRPLTRLASFEAAIGRMRRKMAGCGVAFVVVPELPRSRVSGAARWFAGSPLIQVSLRYRTDDQFWFSVFHECGHVLSDVRGALVVEDIDPSRQLEGEVGEDVANEFARDTLIPPEDYRAFIEKQDLSAQSIREFAASIGTSPGIVVGRLEYDGFVSPGRFARLKRHYDVH